jgi:hypothetical protein
MDGLARIVLVHCADTRHGYVCFGECCSCSFCWMYLLGWGTRSSDDVGGSRHGGCSRVMTRGLEMRVLDGVRTVTCWFWV